MEEKKLTAFSAVSIENEIDDVFGMFGFRDEEGTVVIEPQYVSVGEFSLGLCPVCLNRTWFRTETGLRYYEMHWGFINARGKMVIPMRFREAWSFNKYGVAVVSDEYTSGYYLIDTEGKKIKNSSFPFLSHYYDEQDRYLEFSYESDCSNDWKNNIGLYDTKRRRILFPPKYCDITEWSEDCIELTTCVTKKARL